jgi:hypothetical protein
MGVFSKELRNKVGDSQNTRYGEEGVQEQWMFRRLIPSSDHFRGK